MAMQSKDDVSVVSLKNACYEKFTKEKIDKEKNSMTAPAYCNDWPAVFRQHERDLSIEKKNEFPKYKD